MICFFKKGVLVNFLCKGMVDWSDYNICCFVNYIIYIWKYVIENVFNIFVFFVFGCSVSYFLNCGVELFINNIIN